MVPAAAPASLAGRLRAPVTLRQVRLATGLVLFTYVLAHLLNHSLGNVSLDAMEAGLGWAASVWRAPGVGGLLYGALAIHASLGVYAIYERPRFRWSFAETMQLLLGLLIPAMLAIHVVQARLAYTLHDVKGGYAQQLYHFWVEAPGDGALQATALVVAWAHGCLGVYFWLRLKPGFRAWAAPLLAAAILLPVLALLGYAAAGRAVVALAADEAWRIENVPGERPADQAADLALARSAVLWGMAGLVLLAITARYGRRALERRRGLVRLTYPSGTVAHVPRGTSVLEASRGAGVPHASVCGGRGRCSTCRIGVLGEGVRHLPAPSPAEQAVLDRIDAGAAVRLACQLRPSRDLTVAPLLAPHVGAAEGRRAEGPISGFGEERFVVAMFVDMRGSTRFAEDRLPFDTVFVINRFLEAVGRGVADAGGAPNQFLGDGLMALFGIESDPRTAARQALDAIGRIAANVEALNGLLAATLTEPLRFGIGLHAGAAILGEIGDRQHGRAVFTAIGDPVNVASRLQGLTKSLGCEALVSDAVFAAAGIEPELPRQEVPISGRAGQLWVRPVADAGAPLGERALAEA